MWNRSTYKYKDKGDSSAGCQSKDAFLLMCLSLILVTHGRFWLLPVAYIAATSSNTAYRVQVKSALQAKVGSRQLGVPGG